MVFVNPPILSLSPKNRPRGFSFESTLASPVWQNAHINVDDLGKLRTKFCERKLQFGSCDHAGGWACNFSHNLRWVRRNPLKCNYSPKLCPHIQKNKLRRPPAEVLFGKVECFIPTICPDGIDCRFAHSREEQFYHPLVYKKLPCSSWPVCRQAQPCPFTHGLGDHSICMSENVPEYELISKVDTLSAALFSVLGIRPEELIDISMELEREHDPVDCKEFVDCSPCSSTLSPCSILHSIPLKRGSLKRSVSNKRSLFPGDNFLDRFEAEKCLDGMRSSNKKDGQWERVNSELEIDTGSLQKGLFMQQPCKSFRGRLSDHKATTAFDFLDDCENVKRNVLVISTEFSGDISKCSEFVQPIKIIQSKTYSILFVFDCADSRTLVDWQALDSKCLSDKEMHGFTDSIIEDLCTLPNVFHDNLDEYCLFLKSERDIIVRGILESIIRIVYKSHQCGIPLGGFELSQFIFEQGRLDSIKFVPIKGEIQLNGYSSYKADLYCLARCAASIILGKQCVGTGLHMKELSNVSGLAWDLISRIGNMVEVGSYCESKVDEFFDNLLKHPFFWSWTITSSVLLRGVSGWFQQAGNSFKPVSQRYLIDWATRSFGCLLNKGVPIKRQLCKISAEIGWNPASTYQSECVHLVRRQIENPTVSPILYVLPSALVLNRSSNCFAKRYVDTCPSKMLPVSFPDSHLEISLPESSDMDIPGWQTVIIDELLKRFHLTERTSVYSFLTFALFALGNPHFCSADQGTESSNVQLVKRHRAIVETILKAVPLGMLLMWQLAENEDLIEPLVSNLRAGFNSSPKNKNASN